MFSFTHKKIRNSNGKINIKNQYFTCKIHKLKSEQKQVIVVSVYFGYLNH